MTTGHVLLGLLSRQHQHGYDLKRDHDATFPASRPLAFGQVYAALARLTEKGWAETIGSEQGDGPERTVYGITESGANELGRWLDDTVDPAPFVANPLAVKATIALLARDAATARRYLERQRRVHLERMRHYTRQKSEPGADISMLLAADYALAHLGADIEWLDLALGRIESLAPSVMTDPTSNGADQ